MLSLSTSRLGVTFFMPVGWGESPFCPRLSFLAKATLFAQGISEPHSLCSGIGGNSAYSLYIPECVGKGLKRKESVASEDLQHSLLFRFKIGGEMRGKYGDFLNIMGGLPRRIRITHTRRKGFAEGRFAKCLLLLRNRVGGFGRLRFFGSSRNVACGEKIAVNQRMTAERSRSLFDDGQKLLRHHWEWLLLREH